MSFVFNDTNVCCQDIYFWMLYICIISFLIQINKAWPGNNQNFVLLECGQWNVYCTIQCLECCRKYSILGLKGMGNDFCAFKNGK